MLQYFRRIVRDRQGILHEPQRAPPITLKETPLASGLQRHTHSRLRKSMQLTGTNFQPDKSIAQQRLKLLSNTLYQSSVQNRMNYEQHNKIVDTRIGQLQQKLDKAHTTDQQKFCLLDDQLQKLFAAQAAEKASRQLMNDRKSKEIELMSASLQQAFDQEAQIRDDMKQRLVQQVVDRIAVSSNEMKRTEAEGVNLGDQQMKFMKENVTKIVQILSTDRTTTDQMYSDLQMKLDQQCFDIRNMILKESQESENQENNFKETFQKVCQMLQQKLIMERQDREKKEDMLLSLLEEVCGKVEQYGI